VKLGKDFIGLELAEKTQHEEKYTPSVIEPSFGIGRIVYCIFEHCFKIRAHEASRTYFTFPPLIAPLKCSILPLISTDNLTSVVQQISKNALDFTNHHFRNRLDSRWYIIKDRRFHPDHW
jgi:glycyl-tRNA synthetase